MQITRKDTGKTTSFRTTKGGGARKITTQRAQELISAEQEARKVKEVTQQSSAARSIAETRQSEVKEKIEQVRLQAQRIEEERPTLEPTVEPVKPEDDIQLITKEEKRAAFFKDPLGALIESREQKIAKLDAEAKAKGAATFGSIFEAIGLRTQQGLLEIAELGTDIGEAVSHPIETIEQVTTKGKEFIETGSPGLAGLGEEIRATTPDPRRAPLELALLIGPELLIGRAGKLAKESKKLTKLLGETPLETRIKKGEIPLGEPFVSPKKPKPGKITLAETFVDQPFPIRDPSTGKITQFQTQLTPEQLKVTLDPVTGFPESTPQRGFKSTAALLEEQTKLGIQGLEITPSKPPKDIIPSIEAQQQFTQIDDIFLTATREKDVAKLDELAKAVDPRDITQVVFEPARPRKLVDVFKNKKGSSLVEPVPFSKVTQESILGKLTKKAEQEFFERVRQPITPTLEPNIIIGAPLIKISKPLEPLPISESAKAMQPIIETVVPVIEAEPITIPDTIKDSVTEEELTQEEKQKQSSATKQRQKQAQEQITEQIQAPIQKPAQAQAQKQEQAQEQDLAIAQITGQGTDQTIRQTSRIEQSLLTEEQARRTQRTARIFPVPTIKPKLKKKERKQEIFEIIIGRPGKKVFKKVRAKSLLEAARLGRRGVTTTAAASLEIRSLRGDLSTEEESFVEEFLGSEFRRGKKDKKFIQKREFRIGTPGEKREITLLGIRASKKKTKRINPNSKSQSKRINDLLNKGAKLRDIRRSL